MDTNFNFKKYPKIQRVGKVENKLIVTEKMDGTNACIFVENNKIIGCQSRNRILSVESDNMGFCKWVKDNEEGILQDLHEGYNFGEWCGPGIQKNNHSLKSKTFFLFNPFREDLQFISKVRLLSFKKEEETNLEVIMSDLKKYAELHQYKPEGIVISHTKTGLKEKMTFENSEGKWKNEHLKNQT